jgi:hypothetical protein
MAASMENSVYGDIELPAFGCEMEVGDGAEDG